MNNFQFSNPTKIVFGKGQIAKLTKLVPKGSRVLMTYGGGSIKANSVYQQVLEALVDVELFEFSGIEANPQYTTLMKAVDIVKEKNIDFLLAVGGGSVLDGTKFIALAAKYEGDAWDIVTTGAARKMKEAVPMGTILTLPATGSEMNSNSVVSRSEIQEKRAFGSPLCHPVFSILDPDVMLTLPKSQLANGIVDAFVHVLEQYMTFNQDAPLQDRWAEGVLQTLIEEGPKMITNPGNYNARANVMLSTTMALNGLLSMGVNTDWSTHMIGHELTARYGIDHAQTLAIILPGLYEVKFENKFEKLCQYAERIWGITEGDDRNKAKDAIALTEKFFNELGVKTKISDYTDEADQAVEFVANKFKERDWNGLGEHEDLTIQEVKKIVSIRV